MNIRKQHYQNSSMDADVKKVIIGRMVEDWEKLSDDEFVAVMNVHMTLLQSKYYLNKLSKMFKRLTGLTGKLEEMKLRTKTNRK